MKKVSGSNFEFAQKIVKKVFAGVLGISFMMFTTGFTDKNVQNVVVEVDGRIVETHTANFSPKNIFDTIGVTLNEHDEYTVTKKGNSFKVQVQRSVPVSVRIENSGATYYNTAADNVYDFLRANGYDMRKYEANVALDDPITKDMQIVLTDKEARLAREKAAAIAAQEAKKRQIQTSRGHKEYTNVYTMEASAYLPSDGGGSGITASGMRAARGVVAVDPRVIPLGTKVYVEGYGEAIAADTGGAIKGSKIDLCMESYSEAINFGRRNVTVYVLK